MTWYAKPPTIAELRKRATLELWVNDTITAYDFTDGREVKRHVVRLRLFRDLSERLNQLRRDIQDKLFSSITGLVPVVENFAESMRKAFPPGWRPKRWWQR